MRSTIHKRLTDLERLARERSGDDGFVKFVILKHDDPVPPGVEVFTLDISRPVEDVEGLTQ